jgi:type IV pilus assembly protein PilN
MIRINLLPVKASKKKETAQQSLAVLGISVVAVALIGFAIYSMTVVKIRSAQDNIRKSEDELKVLKAKIGEIDNIKKLQDEVKKKLDVLSRLRKERTGPANRLAKISDAVPDKLWLTRYSESGEMLALSGIAYTEDLIAEFIRNMQATQEFGNIELIVSEQVDVGGIKAKRFDITCAMISLKKVEPPPTPVKK